MKTKYDSTLSRANALGDQVQNHSIRRQWPALALGVFLFASIFALPAHRAEAQCQQWSVGHGWRLHQGSTPVDLRLNQKGTVVTGTASQTLKSKRATTLPFMSSESGGTYTISGTVDGTLEGDQFAVKIEWNNDTTGVYEGTIGPSGKIEGKGWERRSSRTKVRWYSETRMVCADSAAVQQPAPAPQTSGTVPAPAPVVRPVKSTGRPKTSVATPFIKANPVAVTIPVGQSRGTTTLTWDGGPDHPEVEVWLREALGGNTEALLVSQGKGTRNVPVELGKYYHFILKDAGQELAKAVVLTRQ